VTSTFEFDQYSVQVNQRAKYLDQRRRKVVKSDEARRNEALRAEARDPNGRGWGEILWDGGATSPPAHQLGGLGERYKITQIDFVCF